MKQSAILLAIGYVTHKMEGLMKRRLCLGITMSCFVFILPLHAQLADSPWPMFHRNAGHTGLSPYTGPTIPALAWSYGVGDLIRSSPAMDSDGRVYVGSFWNGRLYCMNADASFRWSYDIGSYIDETSSPAIGSGGEVYISSRAGSLCRINSIGSLDWSYTSGNQMTSSPAIGSGGMVYVGSQDNCLYCINSTGSRAWSYRTGYYITSSPAIGPDGRVCAGSDDTRLYCINSNGSRAWSYRTGAGIGSSPAINSGGRVYVGSDDFEV